jgi:rod shape-determining protein MreD
MTAIRRDRSESIPYGRIVLLVLSVAALHVGLLSHLRILDVRPEPLIVVAILGGLYLGSEGGAVLGFSAGLMNDVLGYGVLGPWALVLGLLGFFMGFAQERAFASASERRPFAAVAGGTLVAQIAYLIVAFVVSDQRSAAPLRLVTVLGIVVAGSVVLALPLRYLLRSLLPLGATR